MWDSKRDNASPRKKTQGKRFKQVKNKDELLNVAVWHLQMRDHSIVELSKKLSRNIEEFCGDGEGLLQQVLEILIGFGYVKTDVDFANYFAESSISNQYGLNYIKTNLLKKGIHQTLIDDAIEKALSENPTDFNTSASERINNRYYNGFSDTTREKVVSQMRKWGFTPSEYNYAISAHPLSDTLRTRIEIKGGNANIENEVIKMARKLKGLSAITPALRLKCIDVSDLGGVVARLETSGEVDFFESAKQRLMKKRYDLGSAKGRSSAYTHLASNGFSSEQIKYAIEELSTD